MIEKVNLRTLPKSFASLEAFHLAGFVLESERTPLLMSQPWKRKMKELGITATKMALLTNSTRASIYSYLKSDKTTPTLETAILICEALDIPFSEAFRLEGSDVLYALCQGRKNNATQTKPVYLDRRSLCVLQDTEWQLMPDKNAWFIPETAKLTGADTEGALPCYERFYFVVPRKLSTSNQG